MVLVISPFTAMPTFNFLLNLVKYINFFSDMPPACHPHYLCFYLNPHLFSFCIIHRSLNQIYFICHQAIILITRYLFLQHEVQISCMTSLHNILQCILSTKHSLYPVEIQPHPSLIILYFFTSLWLC